MKGIEKITGFGIGLKGTDKIVGGTNKTTATSPINRLITFGTSKIPELLKRATLTGKAPRLSLEIEHPTLTGEINFEVLALPQPNVKSRFWGKVLGRLSNTKEELKPTTVQINPSIYSDMFKPGYHTQLMVHNPYVVLEDGTHYALCATAPDTLSGQWEDFEGPPPGEFFSTKIEIGKKRRSLAMVVRVDDGKPLIRQSEESYSDLEIYQEMLVGFQPAQRTPNTIYAAVAKRVTVPAKKVGALKVGQETETKGTEEDLIFSIPPKGKIKGDVEDKKGLVEVVVYLVEDRKISEIIEKPPQLPQTHFEFGDGMRTLGGGIKGFSPGETTYGKETRKKVDITGVGIIEPLAAFHVVLVGENPEIQQTMELGEPV
jgi:hypothetical protein